MLMFQMEPLKRSEPIEVDEQIELVEHFNGDNQQADTSEVAANPQKTPANSTEGAEDHPAVQPDVKPEASAKATIKSNKNLPSESPQEKVQSVGNSIFFLRVGAAFFDAVVIGILAIGWLYLSTAIWQISLSWRAGIPWFPEYVLTLVSPYSVTYTWMIGVGSALWPVVSPMIGLAAAVSAGNLRLMNPESYWLAICNVCLAPIVLDACYRILMEKSPLKATLGKRLLGIHITEANGNALSLPRAVWRYICRALSLGPFWIGLTFAVFNKERQVIHDRMSKTQVCSNLAPAHIQKRAPYAFLVSGLFFAFVANVCFPAVLSSSQSMVPEGTREYFADLAKCNHLVTQERWNQALALLEPLVAEHPDNVQAHILLGVTLQELGEFARAADQANKILKLDPYSSTGYCLRAKSLEKLGKTEEALKDYTAAANLNQKHLDSRMHRAILLNELGRPNEALADAKQAVALNPENVDAQSTLATTYAKLCRWSEAIPPMQIAFNQSTGKKRREFLHQLGIIQYNAANYRDAERSFALGFKLENPNAVELRAESKRYIAECEVMLKDWTAAGSAIDAALKLAPNKATYCYLRSCISYLNSDLNAARTMAKEALDKGLRDPSEETQRAILNAILEPNSKVSLDKFDAALSRWPTMRELPLLREKADAIAKS